MFSRKDLSKLIYPLIIEQLLAVLVGMMDTLMVSAAGEDAVSGVRERLRRAAAVSRFHEDVVRVVGGYGEDPDPGFRENGGDPGQYADQREVQNALDPKAAPSVVARGGSSGYIGGPADQRQLLIRSTDEIKVFRKIETGGIGDLADRQLEGQPFQSHTHRGARQRRIKRSSEGSSSMPMYRSAFM